MEPIAPEKLKQTEKVWIVLSTEVSACAEFQAVTGSDDYSPTVFSFVKILVQCLCNNTLCSDDFDLQAMLKDLIDDL